MIKIKRKTVVTFGIILVVFSPVYIREIILSRSPPFEPVEKTPTDQKVCVEVPKLNQGISFESIQFGIPQCHKINKNLVIGKWQEQTYFGIEEERQYLDGLLAKFRLNHEGFTPFPYRNDSRCGFYRQNTGGFVLKPADASSWCRPDSQKPCCTDVFRGNCVSESSCPEKGINLANFVHSELSDWVPSDQSCKMVVYDQSSACSLLHDKQVKSIGFIGNSLIRNFYSVMLQMLTNNYLNGSIMSCIPPSLRQKCVGYLQNWDKYCLSYALAVSSDNLPGYGICNGHLDLNLYHRGFWMAYTGNDLKEHVLELLGKPGTFLLVGIGVHDHFNYKKIIKEYLKPSFNLLKGYKWPKFVWVHPLKSGIFKPPGYVSMHGNDDVLDKFVDQIERFCASYDIPTLDFRPLTTGVWSVDGTHYGTGVNKMKVQMFLNMLASNQVF